MQSMSTNGRAKKKTHTTYRTFIVTKNLSDRLKTATDWICKWIVCH